MIVHETTCDNCGESLMVEVELPKERYDISIYGTTMIKEYRDKIEISLNDWEKIKQRLIPVMKREETNATRNYETEASI